MDRSCVLVLRLRATGLQGIEVAARADCADLRIPPEAIPGFQAWDTRCRHLGADDRWLFLCKVGVPFVGALLFRVCIRAPDVWKLPGYIRAQLTFKRSPSNNTVGDSVIANIVVLYSFVATVSHISEVPQNHIGNCSRFKTLYTHICI